MALRATRCQRKLLWLTQSTPLKTERMLAIRLRLHKYSTMRTIDGVAAGKPIAIKYAVIFRAEFVGVGQKQGPFRDIYVKIGDMHFRLA